MSASRELRLAPHHLTHVPFKMAKTRQPRITDCCLPRDKVIQHPNYAANASCVKP
jgi:hypothetical protein